MSALFCEMPSWTIVAILSRIARFVQHFAEKRPRPDREALNDAIQVAEEAARRALADPSASEFADKARRAGEDATKHGDPRAAVAAFCAADAAMAVRLSTDRPNLLEAAERVVRCIQGLRKPEQDSILAHDIEQCTSLAHGLTDRDPAPPEILDFVHYQAVHEAGHAVVACHLEILFDSVKIVYHAGVEFVRDPRDDPDPVTVEDRSRYHLGYAAGAAAEDLVLGARREWGCVEDRLNHHKCGGTDFDADVAKLRTCVWFSDDVLLKIASLLEDRHELSDREVRQALK